jgi:hypothetical protein
MKSDLLSDIREQLRRYLANEISLDEFRHWFDVETWDIIDKCPPATQQFAGEIELRIAEFTNGHRTEDDLRTMLQPLLAPEQVADHAAPKGSRR